MTSLYLFTSVSVLELVLDFIQTPINLSLRGRKKHCLPTFQGHTKHTTFLVLYSQYYI